MAVPTVTCHQAPSEIPERYRAEYRSHVHVTPNRDPVLIMPGDGPSSFGQLLGCDFASPLFVPFLYGEEEEEEEEKQEGNNEGEGKRGHRGLPPAYLQVCGLDPFRDEALIYERVLREEAGVPTRLDVYPGFGHYFWTNYPRLSQSKAFVEDTLRGVAWLLEQSWKD